MGGKLRVPLKPLNMIVLLWSERFQGGPSIGPQCCLLAVVNVWKLHTEKSFRNLIKLNRNQIVFTIFRLIWNSKRTVSVFCFKSIEENGEYNLIVGLI